jgi:capsular polysaccharide export protein
LNTRTFLFLQGPASPFMRRLAAAMESQSATIKRINFSIGDAVFWWPKHGDWFTGRQKDWPAFLKRYILEHRVSDVLMLGDGRPVHAAAADVALSLGVRVHILEHGYLRPDWLTVEPDGMSAHSRFPRAPDAIAALAEGQPRADTTRLFRSSFLTYALYDLAYHIPNVLLGWLVHPHYRTHGAVHPVVEYSGWVGKALTRQRRAEKAGEAIDAWMRHRPGTSGAEVMPLFFFPLQLPGDYQIIRHAPGGDLFRIVESVIGSFARHAPDNAHLLFKVHPIDNGLSGWPTRIAAAAAKAGIAERVFLADGGDTDALISASAGIVTGYCARRCGLRYSGAHLSSPPRPFLDRADTTRSRSAGSVPPGTGSDHAGAWRLHRRRGDCDRREDRRRTADGGRGPAAALLPQGSKRKEFSLRERTQAGSVGQ